MVSQRAPKVILSRILTSLRVYKERLMVQPMAAAGDLVRGAAYTISPASRRHRSRRPYDNATRSTCDRYSASCGNRHTISNDFYYNINQKLKLTCTRLGLVINNLSIKRKQNKSFFANKKVSRYEYKYRKKSNNKINLLCFQNKGNRIRCFYFRKKNILYNQKELRLLAMSAIILKLNL